MKITFRKKVSSIFCIVLLIAAVLSTTGCNDKTGSGAPSVSGTETKAPAEAVILGEGSTIFTLTVVDKDGGEALFEIHTDKETVGDALMELGLIDGEQGTYGLFIKTVNGITADYDKDGVYWAFYINGEYALAGVDSTVITEGEDYSLKVE